MSDIFFYHYAKYAELLAAIIGFIYWGKLKKAGASSFPIYLTILFLGEFVAYSNPQLSSNLYTYLILPYQIVYFIWFVGIKALKKPLLVYGLLFLYCIVYGIEYFLGKDVEKYAFTISYALGGVLLSLLVILYLIQLAKSKAIINFYNDFFFWICIGITLYYTLSFPFYTFYNSLLYHYESIFYLYRNISNHLSLTMYFTFIAAIVWSKKN